MKQNEIKVEVVFTDGYQKRFTEACIRRIAKRTAAEKQAGAQTFATRQHQAFQAQG